MTEFNHNQILHQGALAIAAGSKHSPAVAEMMQHIVFLREVNFVFERASEMFGVGYGLLYHNLSNKPHVVRVRGFSLMVCKLCFCDDAPNKLTRPERNLRKSAWAKTVRQRIGNIYSPSELARCCSMTSAAVTISTNRTEHMVATVYETREIYHTFLEGLLEYVTTKRGDPMAEELKEITDMIVRATERREEIMRLMQLREEGGL